MTNQLLIATRKRRGWTQEELAELVGASVASVVRWEKGARPQRYYRKRLCDLCECSEADLGFIKTHPSGRCNLAEFQPEQARVRDLPMFACSQLIGRQNDLAQLRQHLKEGQSLTLTGLPGVGKTALALALAHDESIQAAFEGIVWACLGPAPDLVSHAARWGKLLRLPDRQLATLESMPFWRKSLHAAIGERRYLLILDDVWSSADLRSLSIGGASCVSLVTSRSHRVAMESFHHVYIVRELDLSHSLEFLERMVPMLLDMDAHQVRPCVRAAGGLPLALTIMGQYLLHQTYSGSSHRQRLRQALQDLGQTEKRLHLSLMAASQAPAHSSVSLAAQIQRSEQALSSQARQALSALALFAPKPQSFSEDAACAVAQVPVETLEELVDSGLVERAGAMRYQLHPVIADYANLCRDPASVDMLSTRLIAYVIEFLETHPLDRALALESPTILSALDAARTTGKQAELVYAMHLLAPFLWKIALPLNSALSQDSRKPELLGAPYLLQAVVALADHLKCPQEHGDEQQNLYSFLPPCADGSE